MKKLQADGKILGDVAGYWKIKHSCNGVQMEDFYGFMEYVRVTFLYSASHRLMNLSAGSGKSTLMLVTIELYLDSC